MLIKTTGHVGKSKIKLARDGSRFFLIIIKIATLFSPMRVFLPVSATMFLVGLRACGLMAFSKYSLWEDSTAPHPPC
ncbi:MAG: hypothetical protein U9M96_04025 [Thermodesulfobacteriota bacterium]|nr:hypothetical protein [Thermodesulfobacteriota bacterium]